MINAIAPWFGGKRTLAPLIVSELGTHRAYWEPFCGSLAVLLAKPESHMETVNDLHHDLVNLARVIASDRWGELAEKLDRTLVHEDLVAEAAASAKRQGGIAKSVDAVDEASIERAYWFFIGSWMGRNGFAGTPNQYGFSLRYTSTGGAAGFRFGSCVRSLGPWHDRLKKVLICNRNAIDLVEKIEDRKGTVIYCDPPYLHEGSKYTHTMDSSDHEKLAEKLRRFRLTRILVSYYEDDWLDDAYPGWTRIGASFRKGLANATKRNAKKKDAPEVLLINGPSLNGPTELF